MAALSVSLKAGAPPFSRLVREGGDFDLPIKPPYLASAEPNGHPDGTALERHSTSLRSPFPCPANKRRKLVIRPVAVEKLTHQKMAEKTMH